MKRVVVAFFSSSLLLSCGGGTTGTGDIGLRNIQVTGLLFDARGNPVSGAQITSDQFDAQGQQVGSASASTDSTGNFLLNLSTTRASAEFAIRSVDKDRHVRIDNLPRQNSTVGVTLSVADSSSEALINQLLVTDSADSSGVSFPIPGFPPVVVPDIIQIDGILSSADGMPLANAIVKITGLEGPVSTDSLGKYSAQISSLIDQAEIRIETPSGFALFQTPNLGCCGAAVSFNAVLSKSATGEESPGSELSIDFFSFDIIRE